MGLFVFYFFSVINIHVVLPFCRFHYQHDTRRRDAMRGVHKLCGIWTIVGSFNTETRTNTYVCMYVGVFFSVALFTFAIVFSYRASHNVALFVACFRV